MDEQEKQEGAVEQDSNMEETVENPVTEGGDAAEATPEEAPQE